MGKNLITQAASVFSVLFLVFTLILISRNTLPTFAQESSPSSSVQISETPLDTPTPVPTESPTLTPIPTPTAAFSLQEGQITASTELALIFGNNFTPGASASPDQCKNGKVGEIPESCAGANWINGNVNGHKAHWKEGDFLSYRVILSNIASGSGSYTFSYDTTKAGKHAIDYLGSFDATETTGAATASNANLNNPCGDVIGGCNPASPDGTIAVSPDTTLGAFPSTCGSTAFTGSQIAGSIKAWHAGGLGFTYGTENVGSGDCTTTVTVTWDSTPGITTVGDIVIAFGGHVATRADWGVGNSAVAIHGSPYHVHQVSLSVNGVDKGVGSQDLQLATSAIVTPATIDVVKNTVGEDGTFDYTTAGNGLSNFSITTSGGNGNPNKDFPDLTPGSNGGSRTITETVPVGWNLTDLNCVSTREDNQNNPLSTYSVNPTTGVITVSDLVEGDLVTCTYTNTKDATLTLIKTVANNNGGTAAADDFQGKIDGSNVPWGVAQVVSANTPHSISENSVAGYRFVSISGDQCLPTTIGGSVTLTPGQNITCTITNRDLPAEIHGLKFEDHNGNGTKDGTGDQGLSGWVIYLDTNGNGVKDGGEPETTTAGDGTYSFTGLSVGTYKVREVTQAGWTQATTNPADVVLTNGQIVSRVNFGNFKKPKLTVKKHVVNDNGGLADAGDFTVHVKAGSSDVTDSPAAGSESGTTYTLDPGTYAVSENTPPAGYSQTGISGDCDAQTGNITLNPGDDKICTITNSDQPGHLIVHKITDPDSDTTTQFSITASGPDVHGNAIQSIVGGGSVDYTVDAGIYSVSEATLAGWDETGNTCVSIVIANGDTEECTITNTERGSLTIVKDAQPNDCQDFNFALTGKPNFTLDDNQGVVDCQDVDQPKSKTTSDLLPGSYTVTETLPNAFWTFGGVNCVNADQSTHAITPAANGGTITLEPGADVTCTFVNNKLGPTRTLGFWKTHTEFTSGIFNTQLAGSIQLGSGTSQEVIDSTPKLFGAWYSNISQKSTGKGKVVQRLPVDQARMQLAWQWLAAKLNCAAFGCPTAIQTLLTNASASYAAGNITDMLNYAGQLDAYNNSGDTLIIGNAGSATPKTSQGLADLPFWDSP